MNATIYSTDGEHIAQGLQGCNVCDEALQHARRVAKERDEGVVLEDDDGNWLVYPDGSCEGWDWDD